MTHPLLYEINTRCWLNGLSEREGREVTLASVPDVELVRWHELGFTHIWLMGVWTTSPRSRSHGLNDPRLRELYHQLLPGWREKDVPGSPYAIGDYEVSPLLGGERGLKTFRKKLKAHGLKLILDFVPNHFGLDHHWLTSQPDLLLNSPVEAPGTFSHETESGLRWLAHGKDPNFAPWADTVQIDYRRPETRAAMIELLQSIAHRCDGVRCDMAMLALNEVFARTWAHLPVDAPTPASEFWADAIAATKESRADFLFLAEAYWGLESRLQSLGFDFTYDKHVYDCVRDRRPAELQRHLLEAAPDYIARSAHFLENHDEQRVAEFLSSAEQRAATLLILGLPGMRFLYEGQLTGSRLRLPVQLGRCPHEFPDTAILQMHERVLGAIKESVVGRSEAKLLRPNPAWEGNPTAQNFVIVRWQSAPTEFDLVVINLAPHRGQCRVPLEIPAFAGQDWSMSDRLGDESYLRSGAELAHDGLFLDLPEQGAQLFHFTLVPSESAPAS